MTEHHHDEEDPDERLVCVEVLDTQTGQTAIDSRWDRYWWMYGNGSCDCNRSMLFDQDTDTGHCDGCHRYLIIAIDGEPATVDFNEDYPKELRERFLPVKETMS